MKIKQIRNSPIRELVAAADLREELGIKVTRLNIGQPDFNFADPYIKEYYQHFSGDLPYTPSQGGAELRNAVVNFYSKRYNSNSFFPDDVLITSGASEAILFLFQSILFPGDNVLTMVPGYANYFSYLNLLNIKLIEVPQEKMNDLEIVEKRITPRTKIILVCNPNNPTGFLYGKSQIEKLVKVAKKHNIWLIFDEVYRDYVFSGEFTSGCEYLPDYERIVVVDSMSKRFSTCGLRIGWLITKHAKLYEAIKKIADIRLSTSYTSQLISKELLTDSQNIIEKNKALITQRRTVTIEQVREKYKLYDPAGAFYYYFKLPYGINDSSLFCRWLIEDFQHDGETLLLAPGSGFYPKSKTTSEVRVTLLASMDQLKKAFFLLETATKQYINEQK